MFGDMDAYHGEGSWMELEGYKWRVSTCRQRLIETSDEKGSRVWDSNWKIPVQNVLSAL